METISSRRRYAHQVLNIEDLSNKEGGGKSKTSVSKISFSKKDAVNINPHNDDPVVITVRCDEWKIKIVPVDQESSADILYWMR